MFKVEYTPYDSVITIKDTEQFTCTLSVSSKNTDVPSITITSDKCKYASIAVPMTLFSDMYEDCLKFNHHVQEDLMEYVSLSRKDNYWILTQDWEGEDTKNIMIFEHRDFIKVLQHCSKSIQTIKVCKKHFNKPLHEKVFKSIILTSVKIFNLPRTLLKL